MTKAALADPRNVAGQRSLSVSVFLAGLTALLRIQAALCATCLHDDGYPQYIPGAMTAQTIRSRVSCLSFSRALRLTRRHRR